MTDLCARYGISPKSGYKWLARFADEGRRGLADRSRAPHTCPHQMPGVVAQLLVAARGGHPSWGPRKLLDWLRPRHPELGWPAPSTVGDFLKRRGLVQRRRRRRPPFHPGVVPPTTTAPNDLWTADFKGHFKTGDGVYCYPLTIADQHTRFLLACQGLLSIKGNGARQAFTAAFRDYGLPAAIRTDNGVPFATTGIHGLSRLNVWWIQLGIQHQRIRPARPQENGAHERMHKTLKAGAIRPPRGSLPAQQRAFNRFRQEYNEERPHETLHGRTPASRYGPSPRPFPERRPPPEYPGHFLVKRVTSGGTIRFKRKLLFIANPLRHLWVGLEEVNDGIWALYFHRVLLARFDEREYILHD
jgi:transposase InsO family protein